MSVPAEVTRPVRERARLVAGEGPSAVVTAAVGT